LEVTIKDYIRKEKNYKFIVRIVNPLFKIIKKYNVINQNIFPDNDGLIIIFSHKDYWDAPLIFSIMGARPIHALGKTELTKTIIGKVLGFMGAVFVDRNDPIDCKRAKEELLTLANNGRNIMIAPEGTRNKTSALLGPFIGYSAVSIAQKTGKPIVPFAISKTGKKGKQRLIRICNPMHVGPDENLGEVNERLFNILHIALLENEKELDRNIE